MKKAILLILFLISLKVSAQQTFWTPGVPPGSTSFSPTFRFSGTDSLSNIYFSNGSKWWLGYTAAQSNLRFALKTDLPIFNNGLTNTSGVVQLGGDLLHHTSVNTSTYNLIFGNVTTFANGQGLIAVGLGSFGLVGLLNDKIAQIGNNSSGDIEIIKSDHLNVGKQQAIRFLDTGIVVNNTIDSSGIKYKSAIDYSKMKPLSLTPKSYVDAATGALSSIYARKDTLNNFVKRRFGVIHLADTAALKLYTDSATDVNVVDTTGTGGNFTYFPTISKSDGGIWYKSSTLSGSWKRQYNEAAGINVAWFAGYPRSTLTTHIDQRAGIQNAFNSQYLRSGLFYFPSTRDKKWYGIASEIVMGQTTRFLGDAPSFPIQINTTTGDTVIYVSPSTIYPYNRTRAIRTDTTLNYRPQLPYFENITVYGTGKADGQTGIDMLSNPNYVTTNVNSKDVGLGMMKNVYIDNFKTALDLHRADTYWIQHCQFSDVQVGLRGGKQDLRVDKVCFFNCDTALVSPSRYSNYGPGNEVQPSTTGVGFVIGGKPENDATVAQFNIVNENQFGTAKRPLILNNGAQYNTIIGNHFITTSIADNFIRLDSAGRYNSIQSNKFGTATSNLIYARKTDRFTVNGNTYTGAPATGTSPVKADSCLLIQIGNNYDVTYGVTAKFQGIGSTTQDIFTSNNTQIYGFTDFNPNPGFTVRAFGGSPTTPTAVASGQDLGAFHSFGYNGTAGNERAGMYITAVEAFTSSANGTQIAWGVTQVGTTSRTNYLTLSRPAGANALLNLTGDIKNSGLVTFSNFTTAGILHNAVTTGSVSSSLIASADLGSSLALPGNPTTTTQTTSDNTTKIATTAFVKAQGYGTGTVTSITPGPLFTSSTPITTSGTLTIDTTKVFVKNAANQNVSAAVSFNNNTYYAQNLLYQPGVGVSYKGSTGFFTGIFVSDAPATRIIRFGPGNLIDSVQYLSGYPIKGTPTVVAGTGAGTSPTVTVTTNGRGLQLTVTTGTLPTGTNATVATITLPTALAYTPYPIFSPGNANTALLSGASMVYMTSTGTGNVTVTSGTTGLTAATTYVFNIKL